MLMTPLPRPRLRSMAARRVPTISWMMTLLWFANGYPHLPMVGAMALHRVPVWLARIAAGEHTVKLMTECRAGANTKAKRDLPWRPKHPSWRQGFAEVLALGV